MSFVREELPNYLLQQFYELFTRQRYPQEPVQSLRAERIWCQSRTEFLPGRYDRGITGAYTTQTAESYICWAP